MMLLLGLRRGFGRRSVSRSRRSRRGRRSSRLVCEGGRRGKCDDHQCQCDFLHSDPLLVDSIKRQLPRSQNGNQRTAALLAQISLFLPDFNLNFRSSFAPSIWILNRWLLPLHLHFLSAARTQVGQWPSRRTSFYFQSHSAEWTVTVPPEDDTFLTVHKRGYNGAS